MRILVGSVVVLFTLWGGYWFVGSTAVEKNAVSLIEQAREDGYQIAYSSLNTRGFPNRFDTTIEDVDIEAPDGSLRWAAPFLQIFALSYRPNHVIAIFPNSQSIWADGEEFALISERLRASLVLEPNKTLAVDRTQVSGEYTTVSTEFRGVLQVSDFTFATQQVEESFSHRIGLRAQGIEYSAPLSEKIGLSEIYTDATLSLSAPISYATDAMPETLEIHRSAIRLGESTVELSGDLEFDSLGYANGTLSITATNWQPLFNFVLSTKLIDPEFTPALRDLFTNLAAADGDPNGFTAPLIVSQGAIKFGFVPLGYLPPIKAYLQ